VQAVHAFRVYGDEIMGKWTIRDLALLTVSAVEMVEYCESCGVVQIAVGDKYCDGCVNAVIEYLAARFDEQIAVDGGLY